MKTTASTVYIHLHIIYTYIPDYLMLSKLFKYICMV